MPRTVTVPTSLDAEGARLWQTFMSSREQFHSLRREFTALKPIMRQNSRPGVTPDPAITDRYRALQTALADADDAMRAAERNYHAYRRTLVVRQRGRSSPHTAALPAPGSPSP